MYCRISRRAVNELSPEARILFFTLCRGPEENGEENREEHREKNRPPREKNPHPAA
jgi:hypothetical protein